MTPETIAAGVRSRIPAWVARAITLVESTRADHQIRAQELLALLTPDAGRSHRIGISGVPGVGKSTFIDTLGSDLTAAGHRVAVLAVDPSSVRTGGSILGDKTRMARLAADPAAYVRPSPTSGTLGGVAKTTREAIVVVEAAGYDVVIVETVGVGQSETTVAGMVDTFLFLALARAGDQLQGIKKGILELADVIAVNKADGPHVVEAKRAARDLSGALRMLDDGGGWVTPVLTCSALEETGVDEVWAQLAAHRAQTDIAGRRRAQQADWMWAMARQAVLTRFETHPAVRATAGDVRQRVLDGSLTPAQAVQELLASYDRASALPQATRGSLPFGA
ncbi:methylmalonyl Co-A mutase-associated GTPase MeaB [Actinoplanes derwentensis]|uniref:Methylmalonyl-CoA mutase metallochaperone MeaB n=1 Tax=Actinoplanes derwentensis TaxID=113562 RepID=A0A1H1YBE1_9ACTN|nr:methylmalonyl Co-A mutase-associated GTPase MeaB [Actinoplanes derwentensis]GID90271.1 ATPase/protein kinase [Actinoplanes derwentensis]SDT18589.1 methylmalonyl-CoA mutase metallochaperone MeaB [Actinoplanes derwentensis]